MVGIRPVQRAYITAGTNQFVFRVPTELSLDASNPEKIVLTDGDNRFFITFRFIDRTPAASATLEAESYRGPVLNRYPGATIVNEVTEFAANHRGPVFDLEWSSKGVRQSARIVYIPSAAGVMEFSLLCNSTSFKDGGTFLKIVLATLQSNEKGKIEIVPLPDYS